MTGLALVGSWFIPATVVMALAIDLDEAFQYRFRLFLVLERAIGFTAPDFKIPSGPCRIEGIGMIEHTSMSEDLIVHNLHVRPEHNTQLQYRKPQE